MSISEPALFTHVGSRCCCKCRERRHNQYTLREVPTWETRMLESLCDQLLAVASSLPLRAVSRCIKMGSLPLRQDHSPRPSPSILYRLLNWLTMTSIEYKPDGSGAGGVSKSAEKEKLSYIFSTTSIESPLKATESIEVSEIEDIAERSVDNPFLDLEVAKYWADVYNKSKYEGRHAFEPTLTWTAAEEKKVIRRLDWHVCLWAVSTKSDPLLTDCTNKTPRVVYPVLRRSA